MKFKEYLLELAMKSNVQVDVRKGKNYLEADITTSDGRHKFELTIEKGSWYFHPFVKEYGREMEEWEIVFTDETGSIKTSPKDKKTAFELFAAIENVVTDFIKKYKPEAIRFTGEYDKRKLYQLLAKKIEKSGKYYMNMEHGGAWQLIRKNILKKLGWKI